MHPIPVRRMRFQVPETFDPVYMAGNAAMSYNFTGLGLYVALLEPFIVKAMRNVIDRITDDELREAFADQREQQGRGKSGLPGVAAD